MASHGKKGSPKKSARKLIPDKKRDHLPKKDIKTSIEHIFLYQRVVQDVSFSSTYLPFCLLWISSGLFLFLGFVPISLVFCKRIWGEFEYLWPSCKCWRVFVASPVLRNPGPFFLYDVPPLKKERIVFQSPHFSVVSGRVVSLECDHNCTPPPNDCFP